MATLCIIIT